MKIIADYANADCRMWSVARQFLCRHSGQAKREPESRVPYVRNELDSRYPRE